MLPRKVLNLIDDRTYLKLAFKAKLGYSLDLNNPRTFNEKLQYLKLHDHNSYYSKLVDKYEVKNIIRDLLGDEYLIPTYGVWNSFEDINIADLPNKFVLKCTHDSGGLVIVKDKNTFDAMYAKNILDKSLKNNYYYYGREWPYKNVIPRIIAERYIEGGESDILDYKFFCFNGIVKFFKIDFDRFTNHRANYYDRNGSLLPFGEAAYPPNPKKKLLIPNNIHEMIMIAEKISSGYKFLRVDFYNIEGQILFGELTFFPASGFGAFTTKEWDERIGSLLTIE